MHAYRTLNLPLDAGDEDVRQAYLEGIRKHPPEREPEAFRRITLARETLETEEKRITHEIGLDVNPDNLFATPLEAAAAYLAADLDPEPPLEAHFYEFLRS